MSVFLCAHRLSRDDWWETCESDGVDQGAEMTLFLMFGLSILDCYRLQHYVFFGKIRWRFMNALSLFWINCAGERCHCFFILLPCRHDEEWVFDKDFKTWVVTALLLILQITIAPVVTFSCCYSEWSVSTKSIIPFIHRWLTQISECSWY